MTTSADWHLVGRSQGCCSALQCTGQPPPHGRVWPQRPAVPRSRSLLEFRDGEPRGERDDKDTQPQREHLQFCQSAQTGPCPSVGNHAPLRQNLPPARLQTSELPLPGSQEARKTGTGPVSPAQLPTCCVIHSKATSLLRLLPHLSPQDLCMHYTLSLECPCPQ